MEVDMRVRYVSAIAAVLLVGSAVGATGQAGEACVDEECVLAEFSGGLSEVTVSGADFDFEGHIVAGTPEPGVTDFSGVVMPGDIAELDW